MAYYAESQEDEDAQRAQQQATNAAFRNYINTPAGMQEYNQRTADNWTDIQNHTGAYQDFGGGGFLDSLGSFLEPVMNAVIKYGPAVYGAAVGADALGLLGAGGATAAGASEAGAGGLGSLGTAAATDAGLGSISAGAGGSLAGAGSAGAGTLGSMIGIEGGAPAVVSVSGAGLGAGAGGAGLGSMLGAGAVGAGLGSMVLDPGTIPQDPHLSDVPQVQGSEPVGVQGGEDAVVTVPPPVGGAGSSFVPTFIPAPIPTGLGVGDIPPITSSGGTGTGGTSTGGGLPSGIPWGGLLGGLGDILGGNVDRIHNQQDMDYWQNLMNKAMGMYMPGTPEADMLQHKLEAKDAAAGRNSQYGIREQNLAAMLGQERANIMMSPTFYKMGEAARGHYDNSLNSLFGALGSNSSGSGMNTLNNLFGIGSSIWDNVGGLFGGGSGGGSGSIPNILF